MKETLDAYGVAVRSGVITPQVEDEEAMRAAYRLPVMSEAARKLWEDQGLVRQPITLQSGAEAEADAGSAK